MRQFLCRFCRGRELGHSMRPSQRGMRRTAEGPAACKATGRALGFDGGGADVCLWGLTAGVLLCADWTWL